MDLWQLPVEDVRPVLRRERMDLLDLLRSLTPPEWTSPTAAPGWSVKDVALHLLDDDLGWLSRDRDDDRSGLLPAARHDDFVVALTAKNQRWVDGASGLSREVVTGLLHWSGGQMDAYYDSLDLLADGTVEWASDRSVPQWFDIAQDLTERWVHQQQIREAVDRVGRYAQDYLPLVLRTFVWAVPHQMRVPAAAGTSIAIDLSAGGRWNVTCNGDGRWWLDVGDLDEPAARVRFSDDGGWRWLTGATVPADALSATGRVDLITALLSVRGIIA